MWSLSAFCVLLAISARHGPLPRPQSLLLRPPRIKRHYWRQKSCHWQCTFHMPDIFSVPPKIRVVASQVLSLTAAAVFPGGAAPAGEPVHPASVAASLPGQWLPVVFPVERQAGPASQDRIHPFAVPLLRAYSLLAAGAPLEGLDAD